MFGCKALARCFAHSKGVPKAIIFIIGQEFCERFAFYGMRAVLILYLIQKLELPHHDAKIIFHISAALTYFTPIFGALLADVKAGKFKTILSLSIVYALGVSLLAISAIDLLSLPQLALCVTALVVIGIGAGGIKPCVAAFGGDQFGTNQEKARDRFFAFFYFSINAGAFLSVILTPIFRAKVKCFGDDNCYPLAFGFPAVLMIIATVLFVSGKHFYKIIPPQGSAVVDFVKCSWHAVCANFRSHEKKSNWLLHAEDKYPITFINDCQSVWAILGLFLPLPMFWALFDQQGSAWTVQSLQMDGRLGSGVELHPDQMDSANALLVIFFIPLFSFGVYPLFEKCNLLTKPLQKMTIGGLLAALAYVFAGVISIVIEKDIPTYPSAGQTEILFFNTFPCDAQIMFAGRDITIPQYEFFDAKDIDVKDATNGTLKLNGNYSLCTGTDIPFTVAAEGGDAYTLAFGKEGDNVTFKQAKELRTRHAKRLPNVRFVYQVEKDAGALLLSGESTITVATKGEFGITDYVTPPSNKEYEVCWGPGELSSCSDASFKTNFYASKGAFFTIVYAVEDKVSNVKTVVKPDSVPILWQIPQYVIITAGEVMFSVTGLAFAYSQAPYNMKSVMQAAWLLTVAFGNILVVIIDQIKEVVHVERESISFFVYASVMCVDMLIFATIAYRYKYKKTEQNPPTEVSTTTEDTHI